MLSNDTCINVGAANYEKAGFNSYSIACHGYNHVILIDGIAR